MADDDFDRVGNILGDVCEGASSGGDALAGRPSTVGRRRAAAGRVPRPDAARALAAAWPDVVGADVAANARPARLSQGRLVVSTSSSVWAQTLSYMENDLRQRLNERLGEDVIDQIICRHAGWEERPRSQPGESSSSRAGAPEPLSEPLSAQQTKALAAVEDLGLPAEIRGRILRAMKAAFVRAQQDSVR